MRVLRVWPLPMSSTSDRLPGISLSWNPPCMLLRTVAGRDCARRRSSGSSRSFSSGQTPAPITSSFAASLARASASLPAPLSARAMAAEEVSSRSSTSSQERNWFSFPFRRSCQIDQWDLFHLTVCIFECLCSELLYHSLSFSPALLPKYSL